MGPGPFRGHCRGMDDSGSLQRASPTNRAGGPAFDLTASKLMRPLVRPGTIRRPLLPGPSADGDPPRIVSVAAPAGYGKTTLLAEWAERDGRAFAWVSVDEADNDPKVLLTYVARALDEVQPVGPRVFEALASPVSAVPGSVLPRLGSAFASMTVPVVLVLDDVHLLRNTECRAALSVLADHVPKGSWLVLAGRAEPPLRIARLRAEARILEIGPADLSLNRDQAASLLRGAGLTLAAAEVAELHRRTEGWPAGLYLAALALRQGGSPPRAAGSFGGDDRLVSEYLESEFLARISRRQRVFLTRTAALERMCGPLCEAVLERTGSAATLAELARSNLLLVPLDRRGRWYRYHHLFRDMLRAELERTEPGLVPALKRRAARWCLANGLREEALEYSMAAGDVEEAARLVQSLFLPTDRQNRITTLQRWFRWLDDRGGIDSHPLLAVWASFLAAETGRPVEAEHWADVVDRWQCGPAPPPADPHTEAWAAVARTLMCRHGIERMHADAEEAAVKLAAGNIVAPVAIVMRGLARILGGDSEGGDAFLEQAVSAAEQAGLPDIAAVALGERSLLAMARGAWDAAARLARQAEPLSRRTGAEHIATPLLCAVQARVAVHRHDVTAAHRDVVTAQRLRPLLTYAFPHFAVQVRLELIRVHLALGDPAGARTLMREVDELLRRRPGLGTLVGEAQELRARLSALPGPSAPGATALTGAELRLLPLLATHLSFPEISAELFLSPNTVKSQAMSVYRKLGASSRSEAVARSRELALLEV